MELLSSLEKEQVFDLWLELFSFNFCFYIYLIIVFDDFRDVSEFYCIKLLFYSCDNNIFLISSLK